jgi:hypothetical protein
MADAPLSPVSKMELSREEIYREWLRIKSITPSYYGILGVPELETDQQVILHAGRRVKRKLRAYQIGQYRKQALDLLAEVGQAMVVLTSADKKDPYDRELLKRWKAAIDECYRAHVDGAGRDPGVLEAWLNACVLRGVPATRLLPAMVRRLGPRHKEWPPHGEHKVGLPVGLWIYRDAVILGQCLHIGRLERRVEAVKHIQKLLGVTEGLARLVAEEVSRSLHIFSRARLLGEAKRDPEGYLVRVGRRIHRYGGHLGRNAEILATIASLLGMHRKVIEKVAERLKQPAGEVSAARKAALASRKAARDAKTVLQWLRFHPQAAMVVAAVLAGIVVLALAAVVATGLWIPWGKEATPRPDAAESSASVATPGVQPAAHPTDPAARPRLMEGEPAPTDLEALQEFIKKYPSAAQPPPEEEPQPPAPAPPAVEPAPKQPPEKARPAPSKTPTFFSVPAERASDKPPPAPPPPAPANPDDQ